MFARTPGSSETGAATAWRIACPDQVVSPGLINAHDHLTYQNPPYVPATAVVNERFEHRHNWRRGQGVHTNVQSLGLAVPEGTNAERLERIGRWLQPYCDEHGLRFCPRRHIEWYGAQRGT